MRIGGYVDGPRDTLASVSVPRTSLWEGLRTGASRVARMGLVASVLLVWCVTLAPAQQVELLLKGGHVIDPANGIDAPRDVAIGGGRILQVARDIPAQGAQRTVDVTGLYVTPGLIDLHVHAGNHSPRFPPDGFTFRSGVTTVVDAGTVGWRHVELLQEVAASSRTRVLGLLSILGSRGMPTGDHPAELLTQDTTDYNAVMTAAKIRQHPELLVGIKVWYAPSFYGIEQAVEAGRLASVPVMIDFGGQQLASLERLLMQTFRPGDIFTHTFFSSQTRQGPVDDQGRLRPFILAAQERGIIFDVGHGAGGFQWAQVIPAMNQGLRPNTISTDLYASSMNAGMKDMTNVMSKFLNLGMSLPEVIERTTAAPARVIQRPALGNLSVGSEADVTVLRLREGDFGFMDARGIRLDGNRKLEAELTIRAGAVVWDLNGIAAPPWTGEPRRN